MRVALAVQVTLDLCMWFFRALELTSVSTSERIGVNLVNLRKYVTSFSTVSKDRKSPINPFELFHTFSTLNGTKKK
jgi:hypothetical protein